MIPPLVREISQTCQMGVNLKKKLRQTKFGIYIGTSIKRSYRQQHLGNK